MQTTDNLGALNLRDATLFSETMQIDTKYKMFLGTTIIKILIYIKSKIWVKMAIKYVHQTVANLSSVVVKTF